MKNKRIRCGAIYCDVCKRLWHGPGMYKHWRPDIEMTCQECQPGVITVDFCPREDSLKTHFKVMGEDLAKLIDTLIELHFEFKKGKLNETN